MPINLRNKRILVFGILIISLILTVVLIKYALKSRKINYYLGYYKSESHFGIYQKYAVSTDSAQCANIGKKILDLNGTAADAIISVLLCMGVTLPHSMGLGGGCLIVFYNYTSKESHVIDAREEAPTLSHKYMFRDNDKDTNLPLSIGIPGELSGYWELHQRFGRLNWSQLFDGAIKLSLNGFYVSEHMANALKINERFIKNYTSLRDVFVNKTTNECYVAGNKITNKRLADTLKQLANDENPLKLFYNGFIGKLIVDDVKDFAEERNITSILSFQDFNKYKVRTDIKPVETHFSRGDLTLHTIPLPGSGNLLSFILKVMENYDDLYPKSKNSLDKAVLFYHRLIETFKYAYSQRSLLGDGDNVSHVLQNLSSDQFINTVRNSIDDKNTFPIRSGKYGNNIQITEDQGTAHVSVIDNFGNAASVTSTINSYFGSKIFSKNTGILLNDQLFDFKLNFENYTHPASERNLLAPGRRPLSSMVPSIVTDSSGKVKLVIGASGGTKITTAVATVIIRQLWFNEDIKLAIDAPRIHHQFFPDVIVFESNFPKDILERLEKMGHKLKPLKGRGAIVMAISSDDHKIYANSDYRKGGDVDGL